LGGFQGKTGSIILANLCVRHSEKSQFHSKLLSATASAGRAGIMRCTRLAAFADVNVAKDVGKFITVALRTTLVFYR
jgi:hypothetical protein